MNTRITRLVASLCSGIFAVLVLPAFIQAAPSVSQIQTNFTQVPRFSKFEITFQVNSQAENFFFPYDANPPPGIDTTTSYKGVSVDALFTNPSGITYTQPAFYYQEFDDQIKPTNKEWFYPKNNFSWKIRFSPNEAGIWTYTLKVQDSTGTTQTPAQSFTVTNSTDKGFIQVSSTDKRYFEYGDGTYFPGNGTGFDLGNIENNPVLDSVPKFQSMGQNGMQLSRFWVTQYSIFGEAYGKWGSHNRVHGLQEPRLGIVNKFSSQFAANYPSLVPPTPPQGSEYYMWLEFNETASTDGSLQRFTPCRYSANIPIKRDTTYRIHVRYVDMGIEGPRIPGQPFGFAIKRNNSSLGASPELCNDPSNGTVIAATYTPGAVQNDPQNPGWKILEGTYANTGTNAADFLPYLYLTFQNAKSQDSDLSAGHVFIDRVWFEESTCTSGQCASLLPKPEMDMHQYINQKGAYTFDKLLALAEQNGVYLKTVMTEKNDRIFQTIDFNGQPTATTSITNFYGNRLIVTKVRWLQQAWWRYIQARWGYSPNIHSWELLNEGNAGNTEGHWDMADEFAKFMKCRVFGQEPIVDAVLGRVCQYKHPNAHLVSTSFSGGAYPWQFWNNGGSANTYKLYSDIDYADQHMYAHQAGTEHTPGFFDSALYSIETSSLPNLFSPTTRKPFIRGEVAWVFDTTTNLLENNSDRGVWLHDFIWAGLHSGGLMEHFFTGGNFTKQIYNLNANPPYDHRPMFKPYFDFIKDIPLNNGLYVDTQAVISNSVQRAWGQKDVANSRAHIWISNSRHTWCTIVGNVSGCPQQAWSSLSTLQKRLSGTVSISGFQPNLPLSLEWWGFDEFSNPLTVSQTIVTSNSAGVIVLDLDTLPQEIVDVGAKIGNYTNLPITHIQLLQNWFTNRYDQNADNIVNSFDFATLMLN